MSYYSSSIALLGLLVHCLLVQVPLGIVLLVLLVEPLLGGYQCLDMLLVWLLLILGLLRVMGFRMHDERYTGLVVLDQDGKEFDYTDVIMQRQVVSRSGSTSDPVHRRVVDIPVRRRDGYSQCAGRR